MNERKRKWLYIALAVLSVVVIAGAVFWWQSSEQSPTTDPPPVVEEPGKGKPPANQPKPTPQPQPTPPQPEPEPTEPNKYEQLDADVLIELDEEPRLHSPVQTHVAPTDETYTLYFRNKMNRDSVESTLKNNLHVIKFEADKPQIPVELKFQWVNDNELRLGVSVPSNLERNLYLRANYHLDVKGAKTKNGIALTTPPSFTAFLKKPEQMWRVSLDGKVRDRVTWLTEPYWVNVLADDRYLLVQRNKTYCCHAPYQLFSSIYDTVSKQRISYPVDLMVNYQGPFDFYADPRGFFYKAPDQAVDVPKSTVIKVVGVGGGYVHGAIFSKDRSHLIMAVGTKEQKGDYDLVIYNWKTGTKHQYAKALPFEYPPDRAYDVKYPIDFYDDGKYVYFTMAEPYRNPDDKYAYPYRYHRYKYSWQTQTITEWEAPVGDQYGAEFYPTSDDVYRFYPYRGLYRGEQKITDSINEGVGVWVTGTHLYATTMHNDKTVRLFLYDADANQLDTLIEQLPEGSKVIGSSPDGKWIYLSTSAAL